MSVQSFTTAATVDDAVAAVAAGARPVAGGTDLVVGARSGKTTMPDSIVAIHRVAELHGVESLDDGGLRLGALANHAEIAASDDVRARFSALSDASAIVGSHATRAQGTVGGNLMNASPAMETGGPLVCLGATATLRSPSGTRSVAIEDLWVGPGKTTAAPDELLVGVDVPAPGTRHGKRVPPARVPTADGDRRRGSDGRRDGYRRDRHGCASGHDSALRNDQTRPRSRGGARWERRWQRGNRERRSGSRHSGNPYLRRARIGRLPARHGGSDRPARDRIGALTRPRGERMKVAATLNVNGVSYPVELDPGMNLLAAVRDVIGLTGSKEGCDDSECGACMMLLDGEPVNSCSYLALQAEGSEITTVEGLSDGDTLAPLQAAFLDLGGVQCGFCTPGMLVSATALLAGNPSPTEDEVRIGLSGNLCRCTGYDGIVKAVLSVAGTPG